MLQSLTAQVCALKMNPEMKPADAQVEAACSFLASHYADPEVLRALPKHTDLAASTLRRRFERAKGMSPHQYLDSIRLATARSLLKAGKSITEAALLSGFFDQSHFSNRHREITGITPGVYRKELIAACQKAR